MSWCSSASSPAPTAAGCSRSRSSSVSAPLARFTEVDASAVGAALVSSVGMAGNLLPQSQGDLGRQGGHLGVLDGAWALDVHLPLADHAARTGGQQYHPLTEP